MLRFCLLPLGTLAITALALNNQGVAKLPVLGFNTWNAYHCDISEDLVLQTAQQMIDLGFQAAGYTHVNLDDCWSMKTRAENGSLVADTTKFPNGMAHFVSSLKALGFKAGIYGDSGYATCAGYPGSYGYEEIDATTFTEWGIDYLKYDNCATPRILTASNRIGLAKFQRMAGAIKTVASKLNSVPLIFSLCQWGMYEVWTWGGDMAQSWRVTPDIEPSWSSVASIINSASSITEYSGFYGHNDLDMLEIGNGDLTYEESKSHFTAWALFKSPLLIGTNLSALNQDSLGILLNQELIDINQDASVPTSVSPFRSAGNPSYPPQYYSGPTENGTVVMLLNTLDASSTLCFSLPESPYISPGRPYVVRDLWSHTDNCTATSNLTIALPPHGVAALLLIDEGSYSTGSLPPCKSLPGQ